MRAEHATKSATRRGYLVEYFNTDGQKVGEDEASTSKQADAIANAWMDRRNDAR